MEKNPEHKITKEDLQSIFGTDEKTVEVEELPEISDIQEEQKTPEKTPKTYSEYAEDVENLINQFPKEIQQKIKDGALGNFLDKAENVDFKDKVVSDAVSDFVKNEIIEVKEKIEEANKGGKINDTIFKIFASKDISQDKDLLVNNKEEEKVAPLPLLPWEIEEIEKNKQKSQEETKLTGGSIKIKEAKVLEESRKQMEERRIWWQKKHDNFKELMERIEKTNIDLSPVVLKKYEKELKNGEISQEHLKEGFLNLIKKNNVTLDLEVQNYFESEKFVLNNYENNIDIVVVTPKDVLLEEVSIINMFDLSKSLGMDPCLNESIAILCDKIRDLKLDKEDFLIFSENRMIFKCELRGGILKKRVMSIQKYDEMKEDTKCIFALQK